MKRVRQQHGNDIPQKRDDLFGPGPKAVGNRLAVAKHCAARERSWRNIARRSRLDGDRDVEFPCGTVSDACAVRGALRSGAALDGHGSGCGWGDALQEGAAASIGRVME